MESSKKVRRKVINPVMCEVYGGMARGFVKIEFADGRLSISGVIGPRQNGNCRGSAGQCVDEIRKGKPIGEWTEGAVQMLCDIWEEWHLNDLRPYCPHQKELGWNKLADKAVTLYNYQLTREALGRKETAQDAAVKALERGETFTPTPEQVKYAKLPRLITTSVEISGEDAENYEPRKPLLVGDKGPTSTKQLGWLQESEHPDGILGKPCPVCGYKFGTKWLREEVPQEIIDWLFALPDAEVAPAWI